MLIMTFSKDCFFGLLEQTTEVKNTTHMASTAHSKFLSLFHRQEQTVGTLICSNNLQVNDSPVKKYHQSQVHGQLKVNPCRSKK